mgnify:FL=1|tara:strand:+ start:435 stop:668 length:234 start_codon:yes stop_codon:yes gene_type:complete
MKIFKKVNYLGLKCPLPVLKARRELENMNHAQVIQILADDPASELDFKHFCETSKNELLQIKEWNSEKTFFIKKLSK